MKLFGNFNKPIRLRKKYSSNNCQITKSVKSRINYSVTSYLVSIYDEMSHNVVYLFSTPNVGNYQADMTISLLAPNQSKLLKYFQLIIIRNMHGLACVLYLGQFDSLSHQFRAIQFPDCLFHILFTRKFHDTANRNIILFFIIQPQFTKCGN